MAGVTLRGGDKLRAALDDLAKKIQRGGKVQAGVFEDAKYSDGTSVVKVAQWNEFGTAKTPPRPFMRQTINDHQDEWGNALGKALQATDYNVEASLGQVGDVIASQIRDTIREGEFEPISPATLAARLRGDKKRGTLKSVNMETASRPLVDTGNLLNSIKSEVSSD